MKQPVNMIGPWLKRRLGRRTVKIGLDLKLGCPQHDGRCIYCSANASSQHGEELNLTAQLEKASQPQADKNVARLAYFQAHSSTNAPAAYLAPLFRQAAAWPGIEGVIISTRPDCLAEEHWDLLAELKRQGQLCWLELGLQSANEQTLQFIKRGHDTACFIHAANKAKSLGIPVVAHVILGLPHETALDTETTARLLASLKVWGVKLHSLMVLEHTPLAGLWRDGGFIPWSLEEWVTACARFLSLLPPSATIHRLSADPGQGDICLAPDWISPKSRVLNTLRAYMQEHGLSQGCSYRA